MLNIYKKPKMSFVSLQNRENIAEKCWGNHGTGTAYKFYDTAGPGYVRFYPSGESCGNSEDKPELIMEYYDSKDDETPESISKGDPRYDETYQKISDVSNGKWGSPFKGEGYFPNNHDGMS